MDSSSKPSKNTLCILGAGLAGQLMAHAWSSAHPKDRIVIFEKNKDLEENRTWCFHHRDILPSAWAWLRPLISHQWDAYEVRFPKFKRHFSTRYYAIRAADLAQKTRELMRFNPQIEIHFQTTAQIHSPTIISYLNRSGATEMVNCNQLVDASGLRPLKVRSGWQKFVGVELQLAAPHGLKAPVLMDATVEQQDGYRFIYLLPYSASTLLVEDTYYSDTSEIDLEEVKKRIRNYARNQSWSIVAEQYCEVGRLPIPFHRFPETNFPVSHKPIATLGSAGNHFQLVTGYSLPSIVHDVVLVQDTDKLGRVAPNKWRDGFYAALNRMLFLAAAPNERYKILQRFYTLNENTIARFYSGQTTFADALRILVGKPPVRIARAIQALRWSQNDL